jgi:hypothetical protein
MPDTLYICYNFQVINYMEILKYWSKPNYSVELLLRCFRPERNTTQRRRTETMGGSGIVLGRWTPVVTPSAITVTNRV